MTRQDYKEFFSQRVNPTKLVDEILKPILGDYTEDKSTNNYATFDDYRDNAQKAHVDCIKKMGEFITSDNDPVVVFDIILSDNCNVSIARKSIQGIARKLIESFSGAFLIFHYDQASTRIDKDTWRLSWVKKEKTQTHSTPAKRYTYLCGPSYSCRTIAERFDVLQNERRKTLDTITKAFDVEALSDEFFKEYKVMYDDIVQWITGQRIIKQDGKWKEEGTLRSGLGNEVYEKFYNAFGNDDKIATKAVRDYVKKLLGRLVFIQFLQKKEWLKIDGAVSVNFLLDLFNVVFEESRDNFIEAALERVVYLLLNNENRAKDSEIIDHHKLDVPFLNGGLFERDQYDNLEIKLPKEFFHNETYKEEKRVLSETRLRDNNDFFTQCGILDLFNQYNFTIDENDPNDAEVGVDPEMLGKIFENLLEDNKDKGAFYTPKEIVQYMCNESLIAYLQAKVPNHDDDIRQFVLDAEHKDVPEKDKILNALQEVKICDPAIGSGAFPMGLLNLLVALREKLDSSIQRVELKKSIIQNNIYGVDIEKGAIDIARLRFWLSIMVDEEKPTPLPNFEYKFMQGNSLLTTFDLQYVDIKQAKENRQVTAEINKKKQELYNKKNEYYGLSGEAKYKKEVEIKLLIVDILKLRLGFEQASVEQQDTTRQMELFAAPDMSHDSRSKKKIQEVKAAQERVQRLIEKLLEIEKQLKDESKTWEERAKTDILFFDWEICFAEIFPQEKPENERGFDIVIGNPPYKQVDKGIVDKNVYSFSEGKDKGKQNLYKLFVELSYILLVETGICTLITQSSLMCDDSSQYTRELLLTKTTIRQVIEFPKVAPNPNGQLFKGALVATCIVLFTKETPNAQHKFYISAHNDLTTLYHFDFALLSQRTPMQFYPLGFCLPLIRKKDFPIIEQMHRNTTFLKSFIKKASQGDFNLTNNKFCFSNNRTDIKMYRGEHIHRYYMDKNVEEFIQNEYKKDRIAENETRTIIVCQNISGMTDKRRFNVAFSIKERCLFGHTVNKLELSDDNDLGFILALLNTNMLDWYFRKTSTNNHVNIYELEQLPIPISTAKQPVVDLVNKILTAKNADPQIDTTTLERKIDILVYLLYGLTWDEVQIVENSLL